MKRHTVKHGAWVFLQNCFSERKKNQVRSRTSNHCVSQKKSTNWVISHLSQKQLEKAQQYKN